METTEAWEPVIGLEVHAQLATKSKMFCGCRADYADSPPNAHVCPVCAGMPGSLPVINRRAVEMTLLTALALNCEVQTQSNFDRKNYPYPDIPKGYQISQYDLPLGRNGRLQYSPDNGVKPCGITRVHLEEDTGKTFHTSSSASNESLIDYNRSGVPLMEIVSEPDLRSPEAARDYFEALRRLLMYIGVCDGKLQEGSLRADVNVSIRRPGEDLRRSKVEIKNLNSFRSVQRAVEFELDRQQRMVEAGEPLVQETRGWLEREEKTVSQRLKEETHDYRYFPEPDLPPLVISAALLEEAAAVLPELPLARLNRFVTQHALSLRTAAVLSDEKPIADFFEETVASAPAVPPPTIANWVTGDLLRLTKDSGVSFSQTGVEPGKLGRLLEMIEREEISGKAGKTVLEEMFKTGEEPHAIVDRLDLRQITDESLLAPLVRGVLAANQPLVQTYLGGKANALEALVGKTIAASNKRASPARVRDILERELAKEREPLT